MTDPAATSEHLVTYLPILASIAVVHLLAIASPGPTLMVVASYSVTARRWDGAFLVAGVCFATLVWASLAATGLGGAIRHWPWLYLVLKLAGGTYLAWLALRLIGGGLRGTSVDLNFERREPGTYAAFRTGFLTNVANPKVVFYYASLFSVLIPVTAPFGVFIAVILTAFSVSLLWWGLVVVFFNLPSIRRVYRKVRRWMDVIMGGVLLGLAGRLFFGR